jgi:molybdate transport system ATP-binding protein
LSGPRTLLLDEPLTGLHREARADVLEHLRRLKHELAIGTILVSHQPDEVAALADEVVLLQGGRIAGQVPIARFGALRGAELCAAPPSG